MQRKRHIGITLDSSITEGKCWMLDPGLCPLDTGLWSLNAELWTLDSGLCTSGPEHWILLFTVSEHNQNPVSDSAWLNYSKFFGRESLRPSWSRLFCRDYRFWLNRIKLQAAILGCSEAAVHSHPFSKISPENTAGRVLLLVKLQTDCSL